MDDPIVERERLAQLRIAQDIQDRRERLLKDDALLRRDFDDRRADIDAAGDGLDALRRALERALHAFERGLVDPRPDQSAGLARVADRNAGE